MDALQSHLHLEHPDILLLEVTPDVTLETLIQMKALLPGGRIILWIDAISMEFANQALELGVRGFLRMAATQAEYLECLRSVLAGGLWVSPELHTNLLSGRQIRLTPRERQLMGLLAQGLSNKQVAWSLGVTEGTVKVYISRLFQKVGANDRLDLALIALRNLSANQSGPPPAPAGKGNDPIPPYPFPEMLLVRGDAFPKAGPATRVFSRWPGVIPIAASDRIAWPLRQ